MKKIFLSEYESYGVIWIKCSHEYKAYSFTLQTESPEVKYHCCEDCYTRLWEMFIKDLTEIRVKATIG